MEEQKETAVQRWLREESKHDTERKKGAEKRVEQNWGKIEVQYADKITAPATGTVTLAELVEDIKQLANMEIIEICHKYAAAQKAELEAGNEAEAKKWEKKYKAEKELLAAVYFNAQFDFSKGKPANDRATKHNGLLILDFDGKDNPGLSLEKMAANCAESPYSIMIFVSPSGLGIKCLVPVEANDEDTHKRCYLAAEKWFKERYGMIADPQCKDLARACFVSGDPNAWLATNKNAEKFWPMPEEQVAKASKASAKPAGEAKGDKREPLKMDKDLHRRAIGAIKEIGPSISGQNGSNQLLAVARTLVVRLQIDDEDALAFIQNEYNITKEEAKAKAEEEAKKHKTEVDERRANAYCDPLWTEKEIMHKIDSAHEGPDQEPWPNEKAETAKDGSQAAKEEEAPLDYSQDEAMPKNPFLSKAQVAFESRDYLNALDAYIETTKQKIGGEIPFPSQFLNYANRMSDFSIPTPILHGQGMFVMGTALIHNKTIPLPWMENSDPVPEKSKREKKEPQSSTEWLKENPADKLRICLDKGANLLSTQFNVLNIAPAGYGKDLCWILGETILNSLRKFGIQGGNSFQAIIKRFSEEGDPARQNNNYYIRFDEFRTAFKENTQAAAIAMHLVESFHKGRAWYETITHGQNSCCFYYPCTLASIQNDVLSENLDTELVNQGLIRRFFLTHTEYPDRRPRLDPQYEFCSSKAPGIAAMIQYLKELAAKNWKVQCYSQTQQKLADAAWAKGKELGDSDFGGYANTLYEVMLPQIAFFLWPRQNISEIPGDAESRAVWEAAARIANYSLEVVKAVYASRGAANADAAADRTLCNNLWLAITTAVDEENALRAKNKHKKENRIPMKALLKRVGSKLKATHRRVEEAIETLCQYGFIDVKGSSVELIMRHVG